MMQGTIWVESEPDCGSTFHITVLLEISAEQHQRASTELAALQNLRVLVVDDNGLDHRFGQKMFFGVM